MRSSYARAGTLLQSFGHAFGGLRTAWKDERNFRVQCLYGLFVIAFLISIRPSLEWCALCLASVGLLLSAELANSALERLVDLVSPGEHSLAGDAKDMAAAGVMLVSFVSAGVVLLALIQHVEGEWLMASGGFLACFLLMRLGGAKV